MANNQFLKCDKCSCKYLEQITVSNFNKSQVVAIGSELNPVKNFFVLKCAVCGHVFPPPVSIRRMDHYYHEFMAMAKELDDLQNKRIKKVSGEPI